MIDDLENNMYVFLRIIHCRNGIGYEKNIKEEDLTSRKVAETEQKRSL